MADALIRTHGLAKDYRLAGGTVHALQRVDLNIHSGEIVAIMGQSGSGKSTLMNLLGLLDRPTTGQFLFDGVDVTGLDAAMRASIRSRKIGFVFQNFNLLSRSTVFENVELPLVYGGTAAAGRWHQGLPTFVAECRLTVAFQTQRQAVLKVGS